MAAVQFFGTQDVVEAYSERGISCWAIVESRKLLNAGDDADTLSKYLDRLSKSGTAATYTLQFYRDCDDPESILPKTECSSSFNFKLSEPSSMGGVGMPSRFAGGNVIQNRLNQYLEDEVGKVIEKRLKGADEEPAKPSFEDTLMGLLQEPDKLIGIINGVRGWFNKTPAMGMPAMVGTAEPMRRAGSASPQPMAPAAWDSEAEMERLYLAVQRLVKVDPAIITTIEKLADMAEKSPEKYKMAKTML